MIVDNGMAGSSARVDMTAALAITGAQGYDPATMAELLAAINVGVSQGMAERQSEG